MATALNSMPQNLTDGFRDKSVPDPILIAKQFPTHLPLWTLLTKKGPTHRVVCDSATAQELFGAESFDPTSKYYTPTTHFCNTVSSTGNQGVYQRLHHEDAKKAMMRIWLDILPVNVPLFERGDDGKYLLDQSGSPIPTGETIPGFMRKIVKTPIGAQFGGEFGQASQMVGDQINSDTATQSQRYPLMDVPVAFVGAYGDDLGLRMWAPTDGSRVPVDAELLTVNKAYPYRFACLDRSGSTVQNIQTVSGVQEITAVLKRDQFKASVNNQEISFDPRFFEQYNDRQRPGLASKYGPFEKVHVYHTNLENQLKRFYDAEKDYIGLGSDFKGTGYTDTDVGEIHLFNFIGGTSSKGVPYHSFLINRTDANAEAFSDISAVWAEGGDDGDTSIETLDRLVGAHMEQYGDSNAEVVDDILGNPESHFYDAAYSSATKMKLAAFIQHRKDTFLTWCLADASSAVPLDADQESSMAIALFTRGQMMPESSEFGSPAARFKIVACEGRLISSTYRKQLPLALELALKAGQYMGAGNGIWNSAQRYDNGDRANVTLFRDVNVTWRPPTARSRDWANGMIYVQKKDMDQLFFPAIRTGYPQERSIFASYFNVCIALDLQKVGARVWAQFSGASQYSNEQFKKYVEQYFNQQIQGKYDGRAIVRGTVSFTAVDEFDGYSWTLNIDIGGDVMKTVQYTLVTGYRRETMPAVN